MARFQLRAAALSVILSACAWQSVRAQAPNQIPPAAPAPFQASGAQPIMTMPQRQNAQPVFYQGAGSAPMTITPGSVTPPSPSMDVTTQGVPAYPYLNAPMYSSPRQNIPYQVGGVVITNQALYPQEMLWAHKYRAMYPPYYYKVRGHWKVTPFGVWQCEGWKLQGTEVKVNYKSHIGLTSGFCPPVVR